MRALGIDPGSATTGFGLVDERRGILSYVTSGTLQVPHLSREEEGLQFVYTHMEKIISSYRPDAVIIEKGFYGRNVQSLIKLSRVQGIVMLASANYSIPVYAYTPTEIKLSVVGYGSARKEQVQHMVRRLLDLHDPVGSHHATDALAAAICHLYMARSENML